MKSSNSVELSIAKLFSPLAHYCQMFPFKNFQTVCSLFKQKWHLWLDKCHLVEMEYSAFRGGIKNACIPYNVSLMNRSLKLIIMNILFNKA